MSARIVTLDDQEKVNRLVSGYLIVAISALSVGMLLGMLQGLEHAGINLYPYLQPIIRTYYQGLTLHGVLNALVWTTFFICGFLTFVTTRSLNQPLKWLKLAWATFWVMVIGVLLAAWPMLTNEATVLFTFYPPLKAHWAFYVGLTLVVAGTWFVTASLLATHGDWRREHPTERTPLPAFMSLVTFVMWCIASIGITLEMVLLMIPWSLGLVADTNPLLARTLFWYTGHPIVYFWLLPAYVSWYGMVPRQAGGKLFSDPMARVAFILFLILSIPLGLHHQYTDPGIPHGLKLVHAFLTFGVFFPSLLTFFNVVASLENGGRARGGKGWFGWIRALPWSNPALVPQLLAMLLFVFGGISGLVNASYQVNLAIHNTAWVPGHFHLTVGSATTLTFMGVSYWLIPLLSKRQLWNPKLALTQAWLWFTAMIIFSNVLHRLGLLDMPRRTAIGEAPYVLDAWRPLLPFVALGGTLLFISGMFWVVIVTYTALKGAPQTSDVEVPFCEAQDTAEHAPRALDHWRPWLAIATLLILIAYVPVLFHLLATTGLSSPGFRVW
ncbi:MAG: b(o/a)3-type cytochrome-c oxidase subunit 1 [Chloroflexota bacterium]